jgi:chemotaxis protein methyltransferase CheR
MRLGIQDDDVKLFQDLICRKSGIHLEGSRLDALRAGLYSRMESKGVTSPGQYYRFLLFHPEGQKELEELLSYITVNETYFFRNKAHFAALKDRILVKLVKENREGSIKVWSAGCSTGEEPYSIAMTILDLMQDRRDLQIEILGTDVDKQALAKAEKGMYRKRSLRITEEKYRSKYFSADNGEFEIDNRLRDMVQFKHFNLIEAPYPRPSSGDWDIIFCRNVVIYFNRESLRHVANSFHSVLADNGYLFMGHSETLDGISNEFSLVEIDGTFIYTKKPHNATVATDMTDSADSSPALKNRAAKKLKRTATSKKDSKTSKLKSRKRGSRSGEIKLPKPVENTESIYTEASELFAREQVDAALDKTETYIELNPEDARGHLLAAKIYADRGVYERAVGRFEKCIELEPLLTEAHYLLGVIYQRLGQMTSAIDEFRKCIYIDKGFVLPYFSLARIYQSNNMKNDALREYNNSVRILERLQADEIIQFSGGLTARLLMQICLKNIEELSG